MKRMMSTQFDVAAIREELGVSQAMLASMVGVSVRAIQSYEQGWRRPSELVERMLLLLIIVHRNGPFIGKLRCWEVKGCSPGVREKCAAYISRQGHLCWFLTGTLCEGHKMAGWANKLRGCSQCAFMHRLLRLDNGPDHGSLTPEAGHEGAGRPDGSIPIVG